MSNDDARSGALILHGFTSTTASMQPLADAAEAAGFYTQMPLLPGHGTRWEDLAETSAEEVFEAVAQAYDRLAGQCGNVVPLGLSMGGALALWIAAQRQESCRGVVAINPGLRLKPGIAIAARLAHRAIPTIHSIAGDIAADGVTEEAYSRTPLRAVVQLNRIFRATRSQLDNVTAPILLARSPRDNVVGQDSALLLKREIAPEQLTEVILRRSQHVATLDHDAELLFRRSVEFMQKHA